MPSDDAAPPRPSADAVEPPVPRPAPRAPPGLAPTDDAARRRSLHADAGDQRDARRRSQELADVDDRGEHGSLPVRGERSRARARAPAEINQRATSRADRRRRPGPPRRCRRAASTP